MEKNNFLTLNYLREFKKNVFPEMEFKAGNPNEYVLWRRKLKKKLIELLGDFPGTKCKLNPQVIEKKEFKKYVREKIILQSNKNDYIPVYLSIPKKIKLPAPVCIAIHGHINTGKKSILGLYENPKQKKEIKYFNADYGLQALKHGYIVLSPDQRCFGEREEKNQEKEGGHCYRSAMGALLLGKTLVGLRVWDIIRCIDYLSTRPEIDKSKIICIGLSGGGTTTLYSSALDERIKMVVVSGYFCTFYDSMFSMHHCSCNYIPGIFKYAEMSDIAGLIAPRPLFIETGKKDPIFPYKATLDEYSKLKKVYKLLKSEYKLGIEVFNDAHKFSGKKSFEWLDSHLRRG